MILLKEVQREFRIYVVAAAKESILGQLVDFNFSK